MQTGTKISAALHVGLLSWAVLGGAFRTDPLPFDIQDVTVVTTEEYAALTGVSQVPEVADQTADLAQPEPEAAPQPPANPETPPAPVPPETTPVAEPAPEPVPLPDPVPQPPEPPAEIAEIPLQPEAVPDPAPEPEAVLIRRSPRPKPRPVERVAPEPVAAPPPDAIPDVESTPAVTPDAGAETPQPQQQAAAPEEANDQTVTEADETAVLAPTQTVRPRGRPSRPSSPTDQVPSPTDPVSPPAQAQDVAAVEPAVDAAPAGTDTPSSDAPDTTAAVNAALAEALAGGTTAADPVAPSGPPLTSGEKDALRVSVSKCWNVGSLSSAALATTVVVGVEMTQEGKPVGASIRMISAEGGSPESAKQAFEAARRAIIRCGAKGFGLPSEKYDHWREIEMTFNPERMRIR